MVNAITHYSHIYTKPESNTVPVHSSLFLENQAYLTCGQNLIEGDENLNAQIPTTTSNFYSVSEIKLLFCALAGCTSLNF